MLNHMSYKILSLVTIILVIVQMGLAQNTVQYHLHVKDTLVNFTGKARRAIAVNGEIPMPTLTFTEGDTAEIFVHNEMDEETSLHWHGLFLPNKEDGVPYLTQMPIAPHTKYVYRFPIIQHGTHWYHSHSGLQEQIGMYGSLILNKRKVDPSFRKDIDDLPTVPVILSEWTDYKPEQVDRMLHIASDWFAIKKGSTQSYSEAIREGHFGTKLRNEWKRMLAMDVSDVYYDRFLLNGQHESTLPQFRAGDKVRLRISNGGASSYFWLRYAGGKITVVANDGNDVEPIEVDRLIIAVSETYDVVITLPTEDGSFEFNATSEDRTKSASLYFGNGVQKTVAPLPKLNYFEGMKMMNGMMKMNGDLDDMGMQMSLNQMDMNAVMYPEITGSVKKSKNGMDMSDHSNHAEDSHNTSEMPDMVTLNYSMLKSPSKTNLVETAVKELHFELTGNMNRYVWSINNKVISEVDKILIKKGENVRIILHNNSMMRHPMHLHGHDFRLLNGQREYAPLKNVVDLMPMETDTLEFNANAEGDWFFHCHILYHMMSGMGRVFSYEKPFQALPFENPKSARRMFLMDDKKYHFMAENDFATNGNDGEIMFSNTRWSLQSEWRLGYNEMHGYEVETHFGRYIGKMQWFMPFIGYDYRHRIRGINFQEENIFKQKDTKDTRKAFSIGFTYTLPMLIQFESEVFTNGAVLLQLSRQDIPVTKRLRMSLMINSDKEYMAGLRFIATRNIALSTHYDSDMGLGAGIALNY